MFIYLTSIPLWYLPDVSKGYVAMLMEVHDVGKDIDGDQSKVDLMIQRELSIPKWFSEWFLLVCIICQNEMSDPLVSDYYLWWNQFPYPCVSGPAVSRERRLSRSHKFLCLRVGKAMKKTFVSNASASMQQYAQRGRKHEYWFSVPQERWPDTALIFYSSFTFAQGCGFM